MKDTVVKLVTEDLFPLNRKKELGFLGLSKWQIVAVNMVKANSRFMQYTQ